MVYALQDLADATLELGCLMNGCFFGSEHGKGESDGESGVVKSKIVEYALRPNGNIQCAEDIKRFCDEQLTKHSTTRLKKRMEDIITKHSFHVVKQIP